MLKLNWFLPFISAVIIVIGAYGTAQSQVHHNHEQHFCGYAHSPEEMQRLETNIQRIQQLSIMRSNDTYYVPVKFHSINRNDGGEGIRPSEVAQQMCILNESFEPYNIQFFLKDQDINYINNTAAYTNPSNTTAILLSNRDNRAMDIFWAQSTTSGGGGFGVTLGYYSPGQDWIVMRNDQISVSFTLSHEIGHFFSLQHTFLGWEPAPWNEADHGNPVTQIFAPDNINRVELVNGSNCTIAADRICDTPPDYNFGFGWQAGGGCGPFDIDVRDRNNERVVPMQDNYMGYFFNCGSYEFTPTQTDIMKADFLSPRRNYLRNGFGVPSSGQINESPVALYPQTGGESDWFDEVTLQWDEVENATYYILEVATLPNLVSTTIIAYEFVQGTEFTLTDLNPNTNYFWRLRPLNDLNYCASRSPVFSFRTSDISVNVDDFEREALEINLAPHPVSTGERIVLIANNNSGFQNGSIKIYSVEGRLIYNREIQLSEGRSSLQLEDTRSLNPGMYIININTANFRKTLPLIIH